MRTWKCRVCKLFAPLVWFSKRGKHSHTCRLCRPVTQRESAILESEFKRSDRLLSTSAWFARAHKWGRP